MPKENGPFFAAAVLTIFSARADFIEGGGLANETNYSCIIYGVNVNCHTNDYPCYQILNFSDASVWGRDMVNYWNYTTGCRMYVPAGHSVDAYCAFDESCGTIVSPCAGYGKYCPNGDRYYTYNEVKSLGGDSMALAEDCPLPDDIRNVEIGVHILSDEAATTKSECYLAKAAGPYTDDTGTFSLTDNCYY